MPVDNIIKFLKTMDENEASDLILKVGTPPLLRIDGELVAMDHSKLMPEDTEILVSQVLNDERKLIFEDKLEFDFAHSVPGLCRFRVNVMQQRNSKGLVFRRIPNAIPDINELMLPDVVKELSMRPRGLVLVTGPAGSGKSTTLAAMINYRSENEECHIITIEDPIEFIYEDKKAIINQRQVGDDTLSFNNALKYVLRQDPDVILIGEMRDLETISLAITAAETGHLVLGTLHTLNASQTVDRVIDVFPVHQQQQIRMQMSVNLISVISQTLVKKKEGKGRLAAFEIMLATTAIKNSIREGKTHQIEQLIQTGTKQGLISMNRSLAEMVKKDLLSKEDALLKSTNPDDLNDILGHINATVKSQPEF